MTDAYRDLYVSAADGLKLHTRDYGPVMSDRLPVVCLSGLARTAADFHDLGVALATDPEAPRRMLALDYRGRGLSDHDPDPANYDVRVEMGDVLQVLVAAGVSEAVVVGTSRGGLIAMAIAAARPALLRGVVLNDIGPVIEGKGLIRIRNYVGKLPRPRDWRQAVEILQGLMSAQFPRLDPPTWEAYARATWREEAGRLVPTYDPALMKTLEAVDLEAPLPELWSLFEGLRAVPVLAFRGMNSDILTAQTLEAMAARHPDLTAVTVRDQGHAPLIEGEVLDRIRRFVRDVEGA